MLIPCWDVADSSLVQSSIFFSQVRFGTNSIDRISRFGIDELSTSFKWTKLFLFRIEIKKNSKRLSERFFAHWIGNGFVFIFCVKRKKSKSPEIPVEEQDNVGHLRIFSNLDIFQFRIFRPCEPVSSTFQYENRVHK